MPEDGRQFVRYAFYKVDPQWRRLADDAKKAHRQELVSVVDEFADQMMVRPYTLVGARGDADFLLWTVSESLGKFQALETQTMSTGIGHYLSTPYSYLAMTRKSTYVDTHKHAGQEGARLTIKPRGSKYLFVYPFVKSREWYQLPAARRQEMMTTHIAVGHKYPTVKINTSYSFGLDDQDFVVSFESDAPGDFLDLVMELREVEGSKYTVRDTPVFTCTSMDMRQVLESLGN